MNFPYDAVIADSGHAIFIVRDGNVKKISTFGCAFDIYALGKDTYCYSSIGDNSYSGIVVCNENGEVLKRYKTKNEVFGVWPIQNGEKGFLVGELTGKLITVLDADCNVVKRFPILYNGKNLHEVMRGVQIARDGNIWVVQPGDCMIRKFSFEGELLEEIPTGPDTFGMEELENGNIIYTQHTAICEIDRKGKELWRVSASDIPQAGLCWALNFKIAPNGHILIANWLGHGCEKMGYPMIELDEKHELVGMFQISHEANYISDLCFLP